MRAVCWCGKHDIRVQTVPDPGILSPGDAVVKVTLTAIGGSDLLLYDHYMPMKKGDILGHEFMGEIVEVGASIRTLRVGDRVVVPGTISCGRCSYCRRQLWALCDNSNPQPLAAERLYGHVPAARYGYSPLMGGYAGGQAEYARVPFADFGPLKVPADIPDEQVLFLSDVFPAGYQAAENCGVRPGDIIAVWGCGAVGQFAIKSAFMLDARRVIAVDDQKDRLELAAGASGAEPINFRETDVFDAIQEITGGRGPDACIDCVGLEAHGTAAEAIYDRMKAAASLATDHAHALRQAIHACRKGGTISIAGCYAGPVDKFPLGQAFAKGLTVKMGPTHLPRYMGPLLQRIVGGQVDPSFVITHRKRLEDAPEMYATFARREDHCIKVVMQP